MYYFVGEKLFILVHVLMSEYLRNMGKKVKNNIQKICNNKQIFKQQFN